MVVPVPVFASLLFVCALAGFLAGRAMGNKKQNRLVVSLSTELKEVNGLLMESNRFLREAEIHLDRDRNPLHFGLEESARRELAQQAAPDPAGVRKAFFSIKRQPLFEITEDYARQLNQEGNSRVFLHPFDPIEIERFDPNGFQCWAVAGHRIEGVRYYTDFPAIPALYLRELLGKYNNQDLPK
jgi:hypothetical protein